MTLPPETTLIFYFENVDTAAVETWISSAFPLFQKEPWIHHLRGFKSESLQLVLIRYPKQRLCLCLDIAGDLSGTPLDGLSPVAAAELFQNTFGGTIYVDDLGEYCHPLSDFLVRVSSDRIELVLITDSDDDGNVVDERFTELIRHR